MDAQTRAIDISAEHAARDECDPHADGHAPENEMVGTDLDDTLRLRARAGEPVLKALAMRTAWVKGEDRLRRDVLRRSDGRMLGFGDDAKFLFIDHHRIQPLVR